MQNAINFRKFKWVRTVLTQIDTSINVEHFPYDPTDTELTKRGLLNGKKLTKKHACFHFLVYKLNSQLYLRNLYIFSPLVAVFLFVVIISSKKV